MKSQDAYILVTCIGKNDDGETSQDGDGTLGMQDANVAFETHVVALCKVIDDQDDEITN